MHFYKERSFGRNGPDLLRNWNQFNYTAIRLQWPIISEQHLSRDRSYDGGWEDEDVDRDGGLDEIVTDQGEVEMRENESS